MIAGKTENEILAMKGSTRCRWYRIISSDEREEAMRLVETARRTKISKNNAMKRPEVKAKISGGNNPNFGGLTEETKAKISAANTGKICSEETRAKISAAQMGRVQSEETKAKIRAAQIGRIFTEEHRAKISKAMKGKYAGKNHHMYGNHHTKETRAKISVTNSGENNASWQGGVSFEPYCPLFNNEIKEKIRNRDNRTCVLCGKSEIQNGARLSVHHIDSDKMQGCQGKSWYLCALCKSCNSRPDTVEKEFLIVSGGHGG